MVHPALVCRGSRAKDLTRHYNASALAVSLNLILQSLEEADG